MSSATMTAGITTTPISSPVEQVLAAPLRRVHIIGGPGSGKTSFAREIGALTHLPVLHLDDVARVGGGDGPVRREAERDRLMAEILATDGWVTEGVHIGWTDPILHDADLVIWLDYVTWSRASRRIVRRFVGGAVREMRTRPMRQRFTRFGDYARNLRRLGGAIRESRRYYQPAESMPSQGDDDLALAHAVAPGTSGTWTLTADAVAPYQAKLVHCRQPADVDELLRRLRADHP
jgi:cytidylate kinase